VAAAAAVAAAAEAEKEAAAAAAAKLLPMQLPDNTRCLKRRRFPLCETELTS
jgi:hypothetical protein